MDPTKNYYAILGVLPSAELVVIRAAFRALALRYHPDTWTGDKATAERRMRDLNEAYEVLSNADSRREYDLKRRKGAFEEYDSDDPIYDAGSGSDWAVAVNYFPDLATLEAKLRTTSFRLAFAFRATLLETKNFDQRSEIADRLEAIFLQSYFGKNDQILNFARLLIDRNMKPAAKELNRAVSVLGNDVDPSVVINRISEKYFGQAEQADAIALLARLRFTRHPNDAINLIRRLNGSIVFGKGPGWFGGSYEMTVRCKGKTRTFFKQSDMVNWVISTIAAELAQS
jgi:curved DNA-binding protein CbpA